jgi:hypothetical protein
MAPEQVAGSKVGPAADRYSLATIAYEVLTGVIPFESEALLELLYAQVHRDPPVPSSRNSTLAPAADAVIMRGLAKDPEARWPSSAAFVDALEAALSGAHVAAVGRAGAPTPPVASTLPVTVPSRPSLAPAATRGGTGPDATVAVAYAPTVTPAAQRRSRRRLWVIGSIALVAVLLLALGICAAANQPTLSLSRSTVLAGESVVVNATHLPANQVGEIHLQSQLYVFQFRADKDGVVSRPISVPVDIELGDHLVSVCWNGTCTRTRRSPSLREWRLRPQAPRRA